jgi:hypothetical protein
MPCPKTHSQPSIGSMVGKILLTLSLMERKAHAFGSSKITNGQPGSGATANSLSAFAVHQVLTLSSEPLHPKLTRDFRYWKVYYSKSSIQDCGNSIQRPHPLSKRHEQRASKFHTFCGSCPWSTSTTRISEA